MAARRTSGSDDEESLLERQRREIVRLEEALARAEAQRREVERERDRLKRQNERLRGQLDAARRAGFRQAAPFRKARPQGRSGRPGRRAGAAYGRCGRRVRPTRVDERHRAALPSTCPPIAAARRVHPRRRAVPGRSAGGAADRAAVRLEVGDCLHCGRRVQGRHPWQTSDALGAAEVHLGPGVVAFVVLMHTHFGVPLAEIATVLRTQFWLTVSAGAVAQLLHRTARGAAASR